MTQGYVTIAVGEPIYYEMATNLALSSHLSDPTRPISLICDDPVKVPKPSNGLFDSLVRLEPHPGYVGCMTKLLLFSYTPYEETMYVDADCLIVRPDMDRHWQRFSRHDFNIAGDKRTEGSWYSFDIARACTKIGADYIVQMNTGLIYFRSNANAKSIFEEAKRLLFDERDVLGAIHHRNIAEEVSDEPFFGAAMGRLRIEPVSYSPEEGSVMITTVYARNCDFDPWTGVNRIDKPSGFRLLNRFWARKWTRHSPSVAHFVKLKPRRQYISIVNRLRSENGLPPFEPQPLEPGELYSRFVPKARAPH